MMSEARHLLGDLVVASVELQQRELRRGPAPRDVVHAFDARIAEIEPWLHLVVACGAAVFGRSGRGDPELVAALAEVFADNHVLGELRACVEARFTRVGTQEGVLYAPVDWERLCLVRSALEVMRDLLDGHHELADQLATVRIEREMAFWGPRLAREIAVPADLPEHHWWWWRAEPPGNTTLAMNDRMRGLLAPVAAEVPVRLRRFVERGFAQLGGCVFFRELVTEEARVIASKMNRWKAAFEIQRNTLQLESFLEVDDSRRPVDLANIALASMRFVASELRRRDAPACSVLALMRPAGRSTILRFHAIRPGVARLVEDPSSIREEAVVLLDTVDAGGTGAPA